MHEAYGAHELLHTPCTELVKLIKTTKVPIICICNDYSSKKVRTLTNYCHDLRFHRPNVNQIRVCCRCRALNLALGPRICSESLCCACCRAR